MNKYFKSIPTHSPCKIHACSVMNRLLSEHPEWYPTAVAFASYPIQKWADSQRTKICIDMNRLLTAIHGGDTDGNYSFLEMKNRNMEKTSEIISLTEEIMNTEAETKAQQRKKEALLAIHGYEKHEISRAVTKKYYESAIREVCAEFNDKYKDLAISIASLYTDSTAWSDALEFAYHNTDILVRMLNVTSRVEYRRRSRKDYDDVLLAVNKAIGALKDYPLNGKELYMIIRTVADGKSEREYSRTIGKSIGYVTKRYKEGIYALSCILWGYSTREIVEGYRVFSE